MKYFLLILLLLTSLLELRAQQNNLVIGRVDSIHSAILGEQRKVWIYLPENWNTTNSKYPVLYLLDGDAYFYSLAGIVKQLSSFGTTSCPESIIIAIPNTNRNRDLMPYDPKQDLKDSSGIEKFTYFLENELIPYVDKTYPALPHRTLIGHSLGGSFVINTLINHQHVFTNYLAIDPGLKFHDYHFFNYAVDRIAAGEFKEKSLFLTVANTMPEGMDTLTALKDTTWITSTIRSNLNFAKTVEQLSLNKLDYQWIYFPNENHLSVPTISAYEGLKYFFRWNTLDLDKIIRSNPDISGQTFFKKVLNHYQKVSEKLRVESLASYEQMNDLGYYYLQKEDFQGAVLFFKYNLDKYANNSNSYDSMGDYYLAKSQVDKAAEMFKKAIQLDGNPYSKEKLEELRKDTKK